MPSFAGILMVNSFRKAPVTVTGSHDRVSPVLPARPRNVFGACDQLVRHADRTTLSGWRLEVLIVLTGRGGAADDLAVERGFGRRGHEGREPQRPDDHDGENKP